jgi:hypothetical protein
VCIRYHDEDDIDAVEDLRARIVFRSEEFRVHVSSLRITLSRRRMDEIRGWVQALDTQKPVPLVSAHWHAGLAFQGEARAPEDELAAAWRAWKPMMVVTITP